MVTLSQWRRSSFSHFSHFLSLLCLAVCLGVSLVSGTNEEHASARVARSVEGHGKGLSHTLVAKFGKRPEEMYSFGIGKRSISDEEMSSFLEETGGVPKEATDPSDNLGLVLNSLHSLKRSGPSYAFGLGKRYPSSLKRFSDDVDQDVSFLLGSDKKHDPYAFGLGKRGGGGGESSYAFGLGRKRDPYAFGLGKRNPYAFGLGKRDPYGFGLGKRNGGI
eukprot:TRINITY_DN23104_c0_g1_i1.p1 TRINITY_DN23104_c0_g1~~TRINITY_DN23104_c0_g1_i1.p1  ORF type:complete len:219 (+),score=64.26 TRINITY_DN23104_c0_g1_i1:195-851(+)